MVRFHACSAGIVIEPLFNAFATTAFFEFVLFAIFEMRYLLSVWRARRANALDPWAAQRELSVLYARFYGALLGGIFLTYQLQRYSPLTCSSYANFNKTVNAHIQKNLSTFESLQHHSYCRQPLQAFTLKDGKQGPQGQTVS